MELPLARVGVELSRRHSRGAGPSLPLNQGVALNRHPSLPLNLAVGKVAHSPDNPAVAHNQVVLASLEAPSRNQDDLRPVGRHPHPAPRDPAVAAVGFPFSPLAWLPLHRVQAGPGLLFNIDLLPPHPTQAPQNWLNGDIASASLLGGLLPKEEIPNE